MYRIDLDLKLNLCDIDISHVSISHVHRSREHSAYNTVASDETRGTVEIYIRQNAAMAVPVYK